MAIPVKTNFPAVGGNERAFPLAQYRWSQPAGDVWYVHSDGDNANSGRSPQNPVASIAQAVTNATANNDDWIVCLPGHTQAVTAAGTITISKAGLTIIGADVAGRRRPTITYTTAAAASFDITAANVRIVNMAFSAVGVDAVTAAVNVSAADVSFFNCEFELANATNQAVLGILTTAAANRLRIERCHFHGTTDAGTSAAIRIVGGDSIVIEDNVICGAFATTGCIENITTASTMLVIRRNHLLNRTADGNNVVIKLDASTTGLIVHNSGGIIDSTSPAPVTAAGAHVGGNHWSSAAGVTASVLM